MSRTHLPKPSRLLHICAGRQSCHGTTKAGRLRDISQNGAVLRFIRSGGDRWPDDITARDAPPTSSHHDAGCACETDSLDSVRYVPTSRLKQYPLAASATNNDGTTGPPTRGALGAFTHTSNGARLPACGGRASCHSWLPEHAPQER